MAWTDASLDDPYPMVASNRGVALVGVVALATPVLGGAACALWPFVGDPLIALVSVNAGALLGERGGGVTRVRPEVEGNTDGLSVGGGAAVPLVPPFSWATCQRRVSLLTSSGGASAVKI